MSKISLPICAVVPIVLPFEYPMFDEQRRVLCLVLEGLPKLAGSLSISIPLADMTLPVGIEILDDFNLISGFSGLWSPRSQFSYKFLCFTAEAIVDEEKTVLNFGGTNETLSEMQGVERDLACLAFADDFGVGVCHVLTAIAIALPGGMTSDSPIVVINGVGDREIPELHGNVDSAVEMARKEGWPPVRDIDVAKSWQWFSRLPGLESGIVSGAVGRAVAALSRIIYPETPSGDVSTSLTWALLGLEAIYGRGSIGIGEQLREKSELLFGECSSNKKRLAAAYNFRSRFLHGDLDIPFRYTEEFGHDEILKLSYAQWDAALFATVLLISTLQEFVLRDVYELYFPYTVSVKSPGSG